MSKRFTDTDIWKKEWFVSLSPIEKAAWFYIKDSCDSVGVWDVNFPLANYFLGPGIDWGTFRAKCNGNILTISPTKWWLVDFCDFQYGALSYNCKPHKSYISALVRHNLLKFFVETQDGFIISEEHVKGMGTLQEKEQEKEKDKEKEKEQDSASPLFDPSPEEREIPKMAKAKSGYGPNNDIMLSDDELARLNTDFGETIANQAIDYLSNYFAEKPKYRKESKDHNRTIRRWVIDAVREQNARRCEGKGNSKQYQSVYTHRGDDDAKNDCLAAMEENGRLL